jgi:hypothetical protein
LEKDVIAELRAIAVNARAAVDQMLAGQRSEAEETYRRLQRQAAALNAEHQWASREEFEALLPTLEARREMDALNEQVGVIRSSGRDRSASVQDLLVALWAWAKGVLHLYDPDPPVTGGQ